ncbi:phosphoribosylanthranilate isomerase [Hyphomicrobium sp.]|uniref:phosphoribosylanthranilate isomerase n=1 Tax=Hyphomicrobium sp. TaxID=82 RepID=UPI0025C6724C|nr:phosphoribosylanthranilate isomerase [Hyphomicrobium sp.]MCC7252896.1 phosphoribosylanthranilate isomerase [Hyphomicrobium sp.]
MSTRVKICGLRSEAALDAAVEAGADLVGFVLYAKSPRNVSLAEAAALVRHARAQGSVKTVTLLVDPEDALVDSVAADIQPDFLQLHGHETPERVAEIRKRSGLFVIKAVPVATEDEVAAALPYLAPGRASVLLFDAKPPADPTALPGGNGLAFDWHILAAARGQAPFALAGGLTPENVAAAIALTGAAIVDVSSGVESRPGEKDPELIHRFLRAAKAAKQS